MTTKVRMSTEDDDMEAFVHRITDQALTRLGWGSDEREDDDVRLIQAAAPTIVDFTLDEVIRTMNEFAQEAADRDNVHTAYVEEERQRVTDADGQWVRVGSFPVREIQNSWGQDESFDVRIADVDHDHGLLYVRSKLV